MNISCSSRLEKRQVLLPTPSIIKSVNGKDVKPAKLNTFVDLIVSSGLDSIPMELIPLPEKNGR